MTATLLLLRHGKSDWSVDASDEERPLTARGVRQAGQAGRWIAEHLDVDLAVVSVARRAQQTWEITSAELPQQPDRRDSEQLYTFDGREVLAVVQALPEGVGAAALVGHNPGFEEVVELLTGEWVELKTSAIALVRLDSWAAAGDGSGELLAHGRPPEAPQATGG